MNCCNKQKNSCDKILKIIVSISIIVILLIVIFMCFIEKQVNVLTAVAVKGDNIQIGTTSIKFSTNDLTKGNAITHESGSDEIKINENGIYQISYQLYGERDTISTFNFAAVILVNNTAIESTFNDSPVLKDNVKNRMTITSTVILSLNEGDILKLQGVSIEDIIYARARIDIEKID